MGGVASAPKKRSEHLGARCDRPAASRLGADVDRRVQRRRPGARRTASLVAAAVLSLFLAIAVGAERWRRLLCEAGVRRSYGSVLGVTLAGAFTTNFLPATSVRSSPGLADRAGRRLEGLATVIVDRLSLFDAA